MLKEEKDEVQQREEEEEKDRLKEEGNVKRVERRDRGREDESTNIPELYNQSGYHSTSHCTSSFGLAIVRPILLSSMNLQYATRMHDRINLCSDCTARPQLVDLALVIA
jgi:hypothetical protein